MSPPDHKKVIAASDIFDDCSGDMLSDLKSTLQHLNMTETVFYCSRLCMIHMSMQVKFPEAEELLLEWCFTNLQRTKIINKAGSLAEAGILFRGGLLELMRFACLFCKSEPSEPTFYSSFKNRNRFGKALLLSSQLWTSITKIDDLSDEKDLDKAREKSLLTMRLNAAGGRFQLYPNLLLGTGYELFTNKKLFPAEYPDFQKDFKRLKGITPKEYFLFHTWLSTNLLDKTLNQFKTQREHNGVFSIKSAVDPLKPSLRPAAERYLRDFTQSISELKKGFWGDTVTVSDVNKIPIFNEKVIRDKPIYETDDLRTIILDSMYYAEEAIAAPVFFLSKANPRSGSNIIAKFGKAFETYAGSLFKEIYYSGSQHAQEKLIIDPIPYRDGRKIEAQISDFMLVKDDSIMLFEAKASFINWNEIMQRGNDAYVSQLKMKYIDDKKGISQLSNSIHKLTTGEWSHPDIDLKKITKIYPVLLVLDSLLNSFCHNRFFELNFKDILKPESFKNNMHTKNGMDVAPITILTHDDLQFLVTSIVKHFSVFDLFYEYNKFSPDRVTSLRDFIGKSHYKDKILMPKPTSKSTLKILMLARLKLFPFSIHNYFRWIRGRVWLFFKQNS